MPHPHTRARGEARRAAHAIKIAWIERRERWQGGRSIEALTHTTAELGRDEDRTWRSLAPRTDDLGGRGERPVRDEYPTGAACERLTHRRIGQREAVLVVPARHRRDESREVDHAG
jgi:hypothetical protein